MNMVHKSAHSIAEQHTCAKDTISIGTVRQYHVIIIVGFKLLGIRSHLSAAYGLAFATELA